MLKKRIFITSTGRTATQFFAKYLSQMIENSASLHEPGTPWFSKPRQLVRQIKEYGVYHLSFGQGSNKHSMYKLSRDVVAGDISKAQACHNILAMNNRVDALYPGAEVLAYSSGHIYGLLPLMDEVYPDSRFVFILRDPRDWIVSALKKIEYSLYGPIEIFYRKISLQPSCFSDDPYIAQWHSMSKFEKYCWFYNKLNCLAMQQMQGKPNFQVFKYEDIFQSPEKEANFESLLRFATNFKTGAVPCHCDVSLMDVKVDSKQGAGHAWEHWSPKQAQLMAKHCGALMQEYGYGQEAAWQEKLAATVTL